MIPEEKRLLEKIGGIEMPQYPYLLPEFLHGFSPEAIQGSLPEMESAPGEFCHQYIQHIFIAQQNSPGFIGNDGIYTDIEMPDIHQMDHNFSVPRKLSIFGLIWVLTMHYKERIETFIELGSILRKAIRKLDGPAGQTGDTRAEKLGLAIQEAERENRWFTRDNILYRLSAITEILAEGRINHWLERYPRIHSAPRRPVNVGVVMAGNIPMVGFEDFLSVLVSGHRLTGKLSSKDKRLIRFMEEMLTAINPGFSGSISLVEDSLKNIDAVIATGSDNAARYFRYYFSKYPHIIRKNRNSLAILRGNETREQFGKLGEDVFRYFGLGCRNVSRIFVPDGFEFPPMLDAWFDYRFVHDLTPYANNYLYQRSVMLMNRIPHKDTGFLLLREHTSLPSPIGVLHYGFYSREEEIADYIAQERGHIQCIAGHPGDPLATVPLGMTQKPGPWNYADDVDTIEFLLNLYEN